VSVAIVAPWILAAFFVAVFVTWLVRRFARTRGIVNHPNPIVPQHRQPVAYLGGIAVALTIAIVVSIARPLSEVASVPARIAVPAILFLFIGTWDDLRPLSPFRKLLFQCVASTVAVAMGLLWRISGIPALDAVASFLWFLVVVNAFNVTDVCDGLVAGLAVIALLFVVSRGSEIALPWITTGALLGFLVFNRPPASIFLGDGGSLLLGFLVAASLVSNPLASARADWKLVAAGFFAVGVFLFEVALLVYARVRKGLPWWRGSPDHFSLRLQACGLTRWQTDVLAWGAAILLCTVAYHLPRLPDMLAAGAIILVILLLAGAFQLLLRWEVRS
jgi:UDP-GlcNAc:undecaprenyl-phosphate GlcNAc-1-phosphate transferase